MNFRTVVPNTSGPRIFLLLPSNETHIWGHLNAIKCSQLGSRKENWHRFASSAALSWKHPRSAPSTQEHTMQINKLLLCLERATNTMRLLASFEEIYRSLCSRASRHWFLLVLLEWAAADASVELLKMGRRKTGTCKSLWSHSIYLLVLYILNTQKLKLVLALIVRKGFCTCHTLLVFTDYFAFPIRLRENIDKPELILANQFKIRLLDIQIKSCSCVNVSVRRQSWV